MLSSGYAILFQQGKHLCTQGNKEQVSQDLKDGFLTYLLITRLLMLILGKSTYSIQGYSTEDLRPKGAVTPPPHSPSPPLEFHRLPSFPQRLRVQLPGHKGRRGTDAVPPTRSCDSASQSHRASSACHPITAVWVSLYSSFPSARVTSWVAIMLFPGQENSCINPPL
jgi:hypothetical protein